MTNKELAEMLDRFSYDFDLYSYRDAVDDTEQNVAQITEDLNNPDAVQSYIDYLKEILADDPEDETRREVYKLIRLLTIHKFSLFEEDIYKNDVDIFAIYQLKDEFLHDFGFMDKEYMDSHGYKIEKKNYELIYMNTLDNKTLDDIYTMLNISRPDNYVGHSLSISDIIVVNRGGNINSFYVDTFGFAKLNDFIKE